MKKLALCLAAVVAVSSFSAQPAFAIKPFADAFAEKYKVADPTTDTEKSLSLLVKEAKCNLCHAPKDKKVRNEYGEALDQLLDKADYSVKRRRDEPDVVRDELFAALAKVESQQSKKGKTFGELIKAGELPADPIEE